MKFVDALAQIEGAQSVGGQLIVHRNGKNIVVGGQVQGTLIVADTAEARAIVAELTVTAAAPVDSTGEPQPEPGPVVPVPEPQPEPQPEPVTADIKPEEPVPAPTTSTRRSRS